MRIISRSEWNARPPRSTVTVNPSRRTMFVVHHSGASPTQTVRAIQDWCMDGRGFADIDYNFLVRAGTGEIYHGRGWDVQGSHTVGHNTAGLGVCVIGNNPAIDPWLAAALRWLYGQATARFGRDLTPTYHGALTTTECPGARLKGWLRADELTKGDDMPSAEDVAQAVHNMEIGRSNETVGQALDRIGTIEAKVDRLLESQAALLERLGRGEG